MTNTKDETRELEICALYSGGERQEVIAGRYGVTRQRISQILRRNGIACGHASLDPIRTLALFEQSESLENLVQLTGSRPSTVRTLLVALGRWDEAVRRWDIHHAYTDQELLDAFRAYAKELGHLPGQVEMRGRSPGPGVFTMRFGSLAETARLAGFPARRHRRNKLTPGQRVEIARRYVVTGKGSRRQSNARELAREFDVEAGYIPTLARLYRAPVAA